MLAKQDELIRRIGPQLRAVRQRNGITLAELSVETGISTSTLSRLESGKRRADLELLISLALAHRVSLDELMGPVLGADPRVTAEAKVHDGMTVLPLSRGKCALQAYKIEIPSRRPHPKPDLRVHDGYEWLYVLSGQLRLLLDGRDLTLHPGEAAEFNTRLPHWFDRAGSESVEFLSLFGPQGQRMHVRARPLTG